MAALILPSRRVVQPQGGEQIAQKWAQKSPVLLASAASGFVNIVNGVSPAIGSTANFRASSVGIGAGGTSSSTTSTVGFDDYAFGGTTPITVIAFSDERPGASRSFLAQGTEVILRVSSAGTGVEFILNSFSTNDRATAVADSRGSPGFFAAGTFGPSGRLRAYANTAMAEVTPTGTYANSADIFTAVYTQGLNQLFDKRLALLAVFRSEFSQAELRELSENPWQLFKPVERRIWVPVSAGGGAVDAAASGALAGLSLSPANATASGASSVAGNAAGALVSLSLSAAQASVFGAAVAAAPLASLSVSPAGASASGGAVTAGNASAALAHLSLSAAVGSAAGASSVSAALDGIELLPASAGASGSAQASAALTGLQVSPANGVAFGGTSIPATASAALAGLILAPVPATASGGATAAGPVLGVNLTPAAAHATAAAWLAAELRALSITPASGSARGPVTAPELGAELSVADARTYLSVAPGVSRLSVAQSTTYLSVADATRRISVKAAS